MHSEDLSKPSLLLLPTFSASQVDGVLVKGCYLFLECALHSILDTLVDGEFVTCDTDGRPDLPRLLRRRGLQDPWRIHHATLVPSPVRTVRSA